MKKILSVSVVALMASLLYFGTTRAAGLGDNAFAKASITVEDSGERDLVNNIRISKDQINWSGFDLDLDPISLKEGEQSEKTTIYMKNFPSINIGSENAPIIENSEYTLFVSKPVGLSAEQEMMVERLNITIVFNNDNKPDGRKTVYTGSLADLFESNVETFYIGYGEVTELEITYQSRQGVNVVDVDQTLNYNIYIHEAAVIAD